MSGIDKYEEQSYKIDEFVGSSPQEECEMFANQFEKISNLYNPLITEDICLESISNLSPLPDLHPWHIMHIINKSRSGSSSIYGDIPIKLIKEYSVFLADPLCDIWRRALGWGEFPEIWKKEIVTPIPKILPPGKMSNFRKIVGTFSVSKCFEKYICDIIVSDMKLYSDKSQYGGRKKLSIQHYLIKLIDRILSSIDNNKPNEAHAVILQLIDWSQAYDRQCPKLAVPSFIEN